MAETPVEALERGRREGGIDAKLDEHARHLAIVNGSIERSAMAVENIAKEIRDLRVAFETQIEIARAAATVLADETERRRRELADSNNTGDRTISRRQWVAGYLVSLAGLLIAVYIATH